MLHGFYTLRGDKDWFSSVSSKAWWICIHFIRMVVEVSQRRAGVTAFRYLSSVEGAKWVHVAWNVKSAARMTVGLGQDGIHASFIFSMPMIASARSPWRPPTLNPEWWTNLPDPRDVEDPKRAKIRPDNL